MNMLLRAATPALILLAGLFAAPASVRAAQSYDNCTNFIDSVPAVISTQGTWCLRKDLSTAVVTGAAVTIATNNVTIDCNDFKIGGLSAGPATNAVGIYALRRLNATVRHCNIRGFSHGVSLVGSGGGHVVEDSRFDGNTLIGVRVDGDGSVVRRNLVRDTGGSITVTGYAIGINTNLAVDVLDNTVSGVLPTALFGGDASAYGISTNQNPTGSISGNRIRGLVPIGVVGAAIGIGNSINGRISVTGNHVVGPNSPDSFGLFCLNPTGRAKDNFFNGFATGLSGCRDDGNSL